MESHVCGVSRYFCGDICSKISKATARVGKLHDFDRAPQPYESASSSHGSGVLSIAMIFVIVGIKDLMFKGPPVRAHLSVSWLNIAPVPRSLFLFFYFSFFFFVFFN